MPHRKEFKNLKWHEKDFLFQHMKIMRNEKGMLGFDLLQFPEASDYVLYYLILIYGTNSQKIRFDDEVKDYIGVIPEDRKAKHKIFFENHLSSWFDEFDKGGGPYFSVMRPMYYSKLKEYEEQRNGGIIDRNVFAEKVQYMKACFFYIPQIRN